MLRKLTYFSIDHPKTIILIVLVVTMILMALALFRGVKIDTDPENMLEANQPDRVFYDQVKKDFGIYDMIVVGITDQQGIFRLETLGKIQHITDEILKIKGVIIEDVMSLTTTNDVTASGGLLEMRRIMEEAPQNPEAVENVKAAIFGNPLFIEKLASKDETSIAIYIPIQEKKMSYRISKEIDAIVKNQLDEGQKYHVAGLPVAEDTFGFEMFRQMGIMAPLAMMVIFLIMLLFFRKLTLLISPMIVAMFSVIWSMGLLIGLGFTVHIMSSMIPIFLMPIAVLNSVHILSEFYERYAELRDKKLAMRKAIDELFTPMIYTSLTTMVGFGSQMLAPIPPVQVFGGFIAFGVLVAWLLSLTFLPACTMLVREEKLEKRIRTQAEAGQSLLGRILSHLGNFAFNRSTAVVVMAVILFGLGIWGVSQIVVNDNPVRWFKSDHKIRVADREMNRLFGGTYMVYLVTEGTQEDDIKRPEVIEYIDKLQNFLEDQEVIGNTSSVADIIKRVNYVLHDKDNRYDVVPKTQEEIGQYLFLFLMSGDPNDLNNFVDYNYRAANIWVQMKRGDNKEIENLQQAVSGFIAQNSLPPGIKLGWSGLTYINKVWQDVMVGGMIKAVSSSFGLVFIMMIILFRSFGLAFISMLPLSFSIVLSYGILGLIGKDYDMPVAVCASLALGLAIDLAIHFCFRFRSRYAEQPDLGRANRLTFQHPTRAIARNALVIIFGFLPLVFASLTPYVTVGAFFAMLMTFSVLTTLILLPALMRIFGRRLFKRYAMNTQKTTTTTLIFILCGFVLTFSSFAQEKPNAFEIMKKSHLALFYAGDDFKAQIHMRLISKEGKERIRDLTMLRKDVQEGGEQKYFIYFSKPADVRDMTFMVVKYPKKDDDRWIYLPAIKMVRRIAANDKQSSFVGSDFTYEDISGRDLEEDNYTFKREETFSGKECFVIESAPKSEKNAGWIKKISWIHKQSFIPLKEEYYDKRGDLWKVFTAEVKVIQGFPTIMKRTMQNAQSGNKTEVTFKVAEYNLGFPDDLFSERSLRSTPMQWIQ